MGEDGVVSSDGQVEEGQEAGTQSQQDGQQNDKFIPYERFSQVYGKMKEYEAAMKSYKDFGDPNKLRDTIREHSQWKKSLEDYHKQQQMTPDEKTEVQRQAAIRKELLKVYPELQGINDLKELREAINEMRQSFTSNKAETYLKEASNKFTDVLKTSGVDVKHQAKIEDYIVSQMSEEQKMAFVGGDFSIAEAIFNNELKEGLFSAMRSKGMPSAPFKRNLPGGTPPKASGDRIKNLKEAEDKAWAMLNS